MKTASQKQLLLGIILPLAAVGIVGGPLAVLCGGFAKVTVRNLERIHEGIPEWRVRTIFGCPPGHYESPGRWVPGLATLRGGERKEWTSDEGLFLVCFSYETGRVIAKRHCPCGGDDRMELKEEHE